MPQLFTNTARALLASGILAADTSLTVEAVKADLFPTANTGTGSVPAATNWFKLTLQDSSGNVEVVYVRTRTAGSGIMSNLLRGQEGTTARDFTAGTVAGLRITAADVEGSIAAAANSVQLTGNQTIAGTKTFSSQIVASAGVAGDITGNAGTVTNGVYTTGDQTVGGLKTFGGAIGVSGQTATNTQWTTGGWIKGVSLPQGNTLWWPKGATSHAKGIGATSDNNIYFAASIADSGAAVTYPFTFDMSGGNFTASGNVTAYSDIRLKTDLVGIVRALDKVKRLTGYTYTRTDTGQRQTGLVAQDVLEVLPEAVVEGEYLSLAYGNLMGLMVEAVKELAARVEELEAR